MPQLFASPLPQVTDVAEVRSRLLRWLDGTTSMDPLADAVVLVACELVTNAIRHAGTGFTMTVDIASHGCVRVEVFDEDCRMPERVAADDGATSGRGLEIVDALATRWGATAAVREGVEGKVVWAEITRSW